MLSNTLQHEGLGSKWVSQSGHRLVEVHHRHLRVGVVGSLSEKCPRGQLGKSPTEHASARWCPATFPAGNSSSDGKQAQIQKHSSTKRPWHTQPTHTHTHKPTLQTSMMHTTKQREQAEPTLLRATPWLGGVNTQQNTVTQSTWTLSKGTGMPGTQSNQWGGIWTSKGTGHLGKGHAARGYQWGQQREIFTMEALAAAPAMIPGKGAGPWGGRGRGWGQGVPGVPFCSSLPGSPLPRREEGSPLGGKGGEANWSQPRSWSDWTGKGWNLRGQGYLGKGHCPGGGRGGKGGAIHNKAPLVAPAVALGKGALPLGGKGSGWGRGVPQVPSLSSPPGSLPRGKPPNWSGSKGGGAQGSDQNGGDNGWQQWRGKRATAMGAQDGGHTVKITNYWQPLQQTGTPAVHPREQRLWGADEDPFVPIRNGLNGSKGRQPAPSRGVSQSATWGGCAWRRPPTSEFHQVSIVHKPQQVQN